MKKRAEASLKIKEKLSRCKSENRNVSPVLKLLLVDINSVHHNRTFNIWYPKEEHLHLKEDDVVTIYNIVSKYVQKNYWFLGYFFKRLLIGFRQSGVLSSTSKMFIEKNKLNLDRFMSLQRQVTTILKTLNPQFRPVFGEFDTVGIVVYIDIQECYQNIWLCDQNTK